MYVLPDFPRAGSAIAASARASAVLCHRRFDHLGATALEHTATAVTGMRLEKEEVQALRKEICAPCIEGKMKRAPFPAARRTTGTALELLFTDVCGQIPTRIPGGNNYFVNVIDSHTRWKAVVPINTKGMADKVLMEVVNLWETQTGLRTKFIQSDGCKEYLSHDNDAWKAVQGISHRTTNSYTPQHNGVAER